MQTLDEAKVLDLVDGRIKEAVKEALRGRSYRTIRECRPNELIDIHLNTVIAARLKSAREFSGLDQRVAAERLGFSNSSPLSKIENWPLYQDRIIPLALIFRAATLYEVTADYLFGLSDYYETDLDALTRRFVASSVLDTWERAREEDLALLMRLVNEVAAVSESMIEISRAVGKAEETLRKVRDLNAEIPGFQIKDDDDGPERPGGFDDLACSNNLLTDFGRANAAVKRCSNRLNDLKRKAAYGRKTAARNHTKRMMEILQHALDLEAPAATGG
jgi:transcriptional regulator with XRE-family HTH domain